MRQRPAINTISPLEASKADIPELVRWLSTDESGLDGVEAKRRLDIVGFNSLTETKEVSPVLEFLNNFTNPLVLLLLVIALVSYLTGSVTDTIIIGAMVVVSATLNFLQEYKASQATKALLSRVAHTAMVYRHGFLQEMPVTRLVPGDVIELNAGDLVPADGRIIEATSFFVNQATLTGESFPVEKTAATLAAPTNDLISLNNMVFSGTGVHTGRAKVVVVATGKESQLGKLNLSLYRAQGRDEFSSSIRAFTIMIMKIISIFVVIIFGATSWWHHDLVKSISFSLAVAVGLTPEFLPMILSVTMGQGSRVMAKKGVIVKRLTAIPSFGSMDVLCTDKTGTLTENKIQVISFVDVFGAHSDLTWKYAYLNSFFQSGITNPMDEAVIAYGGKPHKGYKKLNEIPFDFERRRLTVILRTPEEEHEMVIKGAPESILDIITHYYENNAVRTLTPAVKACFNEVYADLSQQGFRVLAVAVKRAKGQHTFSARDEAGSIFVGFVAFLDPAKEGVRHALDELERLHVELKVISGDNELVTRKICEQVDIPIKGVMLGNEVDSMSDEQLAKQVETTTVFARFNPEQKNRIIRALQKNCHVVGYLGDGVNDAPSLMTADVGISVANAVDVAREAADLVLTKKSLYRLALGVKEGRKTFGNTMKYVLMGLSSNFGNMFSMLGGAILLPFLPMLPIQILLNNFLYDLSQITIPGDRVDEEYVIYPKRMDLASIKRFMFLFGPISSLFDFISFGMLYLFYAGNPAGFQTGWFIESLATQILVIYIIRTRKMPFWRSKPSLSLMMTTILVVLAAWVLPFTILGGYFGLEALRPDIMLLLAGVVVGYLLMAEVMKRVYLTLLPHNASVA